LSGEVVLHKDREIALRQKTIFSGFAYGKELCEVGIYAGNAESTTYTFEEYLRTNSEKGTPGTGFDLESERILRIDVDGSVWLKPSSAIAYRGKLSFERLPVLKGAGLKEMALRELIPLARAIGNGRIYCAHRGYHLRILQLAGEKFASTVDRFSPLKTRFSSRCP
jgi:hypothetical protein